jgi:HAD superfamily hydrolase (TIGR01509 family)
MTAPKFDAVLFDCDGVLVDSEPIVNRLLCEMMNDLGWKLTLEESIHVFLGKAVKDNKDLIEKNTGKPLTDEWMRHFRARRDAALVEQMLATDGIHETLDEIVASYGTKIAVASGADRGKIEVMLGKVGLMKYFEGRIFSGHELPRSKPFPDVYLAAAAALGADPKRCVVIEDTPTGVKAGVAAGATVLGFAPTDPIRVAMHGDGSDLIAHGAKVVFREMRELVQLV